ncbi:unnamed protein product [Adineta steineri]|uniref:Uncharacterized protein n=1 Tax=Adineta steineri TaxID=433720 RepID=A0A814WBH6_9BILA|nr:unnamed protein product [Adineta steineri]CAF1199108.1 unnamed protein product [Adineta steineri]CAF1225641.1 unnamed protein product [Adineta steineri]
MADQPYQCFRFKDSEYKVPIQPIDGESFVLLDDIHGRTGYKGESFSCKSNPVRFVRNNRYEREIPLRIPAMPNSIIDCDIVEGMIGVTTIHNKLDRLQKSVERIDEKVDKIDLDMEILKKKADALLRQTFQLAEFTVPRLFIILPDTTSKLKQMNRFRNCFRLFFFCEHEEQCHLAFHDGYELDQPGKFIQKYGPYLKNMITVVNVALTVSGVLIPQLGHVASGIYIPEVLRDKRFLTNFQEKLKPLSAMLDEHIPSSQLDSLRNMTLEGADLRQMESFLQKKDIHRTLGNLYRSTREDGSVRWVCLHHYNKFYCNEKSKQLRKQFRTQGGIIQGDEMTINEIGMKNIDELLNIISQGLHLVKLTLRDCKIRESTFDKFLILIGDRQHIKYFELDSITISSFISLTITHRDIIKKLEKTVNKCEHLTITYIVKYPKDKSTSDLDLFDFGLKQSTERLLLHVYTHDDGKKIALYNLNKSDILRIIKSLEQNQTITNCSINQFDREISNALQINNTITHLTISSIQFDDKLIVDLQQFILKKPCLRALRFLLCENLLLLIRMLSQALVKHETLEVLALNNISISKQVTELATMLKKNDHLTELNLTLDTGIDMQTLINVSDALKANQSLEILKLIRIRGGGTQHISNINLFELFCEKTSIKKLALGFYEYKPKISLFREVIQSPDTLQNLTLNNCNILASKTFNSTSSIIISESLVSLSLHCCELPFDEAIHLFRGLVKNKTLAALSLSNMYIPSGTSDTNLSVEWAKMIEQNTGLRKITYSHGRLGNQAAKLIGEALLNNTTLQELNISFNRIGYDGAVALTQALKTNKALLLLNIRDNNIEDNGVKQVLEILQSNTTLQYLNILHQSDSKDYSTSFNREKEDLLNANEFIEIH